MKTLNLHYIAATADKERKSLDVQNIKDFCQIIERHHIKEVFVLEKENNFAVAYQHFLLTINQKGYQNLDDYKNGFQNNFPTSEEYYEAQTLDLHTYESFQLMKTCGIQDIQLYKLMEEKDFIKGYKIFLEYQEENQNKELSFASPYELYQYTKENKFEDFHQFFECHKNGFKTFLEQQVAEEMGFTNSVEYKEALENGFSNYPTFKAARDIGIATQEEYDKKTNLELEDEGCIHDQKVLLLLLNKIEQGKKVSLNKIKSLFEEELKQYYTPENNLPSWFTTSLNDTETLIKFLNKNEKAVKLGEYDADGEFFEIKPLNDRNVVIDASNVAFNSIERKGKKPALQNLITMVKFLKKKGFTDIVVIADAALRHRVSDIEKMEELEKETSYFVAPAETSADVFMLSMVKSKHCLLVSNDTFREYKLKDAWLAANIDYFRLTFMITEDAVIMPELENKN